MPAKGLKSSAARRDAEIAAAIKLDIFRHQKFQASVHGSNPASVTFRADVAEKFQIAAQLAEEAMIERD